MQQPPPYGQQSPSEQPPFGMPPGQDLQPQEDNDKIIAALAYIFCPIVSIVVLVTEMKNKPFLKFHAYQSLVVGIALIVLYTILSITVVGLCLAPVLFIGQIYFAYMAYTKGAFKIPGVTDLTYNLFKDTPRIS